MRRIIKVLVLGAVLVVIMAASALPAFAAQDKTFTCTFIVFFDGQPEEVAIEGVSKEEAKALQQNADATCAKE